MKSSTCVWIFELARALESSAGTGGAAQPRGWGRWGEVEEVAVVVGCGSGVAVAWVEAGGAISGALVDAEVGERAPVRAHVALQPRAHVEPSYR